MSADSFEQLATRDLYKAHRCRDREGEVITNGNGEPIEPAAVICGNCGRGWCEHCDPAPAAMCHWCNGAGGSDHHLGDTLEGMTAARWARLSPRERDGLRDLSNLTPELIGLEGWRVEVVSKYEEEGTRRFIVGRSTGWRPIHIELSRRDSSGGIGADRGYKQVTRLYQVRRVG